jgi:hypothetical protein
LVLIENQPKILVIENRAAAAAALKIVNTKEMKTSFDQLGFAVLL